MNLISKVIFSYDIRAGRFGQSSSFESIDELKQVIQEAQYQKPYNLSVKRTIQIIDTDIKPKESDFGSVFFPTLINPTVRVEIPAETISFSVADKLLYPKDVRKILNQKYGSVLNFDEKKLDENKPIRSFYVQEEHEDSALGYNEHIVRNVYYSQLSPKDIVVNDKLEQIWPEKTKTAPESLNKILAKTKEEVKQR